MIIYVYVIVALSITGFMLLLTKMALLSRNRQVQRRSISIRHVLIVLLLLFVAMQMVRCKDTNSSDAVTDATTEREPVVTGQEKDSEVVVTRQTDADGNVMATVVTSTKKGDEVVTEEKLITGTAAEVDTLIMAKPIKK